MPDAYDEAVAYFTAHPGEIKDAWRHPMKHEYGYLFSYLTPSREPGNRPDGKPCGCPTIIKTTMDQSEDRQEFAWTDELTMVIRCDEEIPRYFGAMLEWFQVASLLALANAQRIADRMLGRRTPNAAELHLGAGI